MTDHVSLSTFLQPLVSAVKAVAVSTWVAAEISEYRDTHHVYITLIETDESGATVASLKASLWASGKSKLIARFQEGTGGERLRKGIKILVLLKPSLHPLYGLSATIENIDPTFTLGEAARKLIELRTRLQAEGTYDNQRALPSPTDFTHVAVLCPAGAAGLGDFQSHADPLEAARLCRFEYFSATFQGERTSAEVVSGLRAIYRAHKEAPFDAVIILRGGGAQADLAWLNDYEIANAVTKMPLPVLVAIGHERDLTILDEIANVSFHTPSKAIGFIVSSIVDNARSALAAFDSIITSTTKTIALVTQSIDRSRETIHLTSVHQLRVYIDSVASCRHSITAGASSAIDRTDTVLRSNAATIKDLAYRQSELVAMNLNAGIETIGMSSEKCVAAAEHGLSRAREIIHGTVLKGIAVAETEIDGHLGLIRDRSILSQTLIAKHVQSVTGLIRDSAMSQVVVVLTDIDGRRSLIRDRSRLTVETIQERVKAEAELVLGFGPAKTLQRGFVMTKKKGKPLTRKAQVGNGEHIELQFADGNIGATTD